MGVLDLAPGSNTQRGFWGLDFRLVDGYVHVKSTGTRFKNDWQLWKDIGRWFTYYLFVRLHGFWMRAPEMSPRGTRRRRAAPTATGGCCRDTATTSPEGRPAPT